MLLFWCLTLVPLQPQRRNLSVCRHISRENQIRSNYFRCNLSRCKDIINLYEMTNERFTKTENPKNIQSSMLHNLVAPRSDHLKVRLLHLLFYTQRKTIFTIWNFNLPSWFSPEPTLADWRAAVVWKKRRTQKFTYCAILCSIQFSQWRKNIIWCRRNRKCQCSFIRQKWRRKFLHECCQFSCHRRGVFSRIEVF